MCTCVLSRIDGPNDRRCALVLFIKVCTDDYVRAVMQPGRPVNYPYQGEPGYQRESQGTRVTRRDISIRIDLKLVSKVQSTHDPRAMCGMLCKQVDLVITH